jgi:hypothetical protein
VPHPPARLREEGGGLSNLPRFVIPTEASAASVVEGPCVLRVAPLIRPNRPTFTPQIPDKIAPMDAPVRRYRLLPDELPIAEKRLVRRYLVPQLAVVLTVIVISAVIGARKSTSTTGMFAVFAGLFVTYVAFVSLPKTCHPDRSEAQQAKWRDLVSACSTQKVRPATFSQFAHHRPEQSPPFARNIRYAYLA